MLNATFETQSVPWGKNMMSNQVAIKTSHIWMVKPVISRAILNSKMLKSGFREGWAKLPEAEVPTVISAVGCGGFVISKTH